MCTIDWNSIRPWKGSRSGGFEELCVQLARVETPDGAKFVPTGTHDAGVECYCVLSDGNEWGWQAKYFTSSLTDDQWYQLDCSVKTALDKHPRLVCYYVCIPRERSDARKRNQTSEMDRWNTHVNNWGRWAQERGMNVEFIWWGSSDLLARLSREEHRGRRFFWFGQQEFDQAWFRLRLDESVEAAGPRYTSEIHVDLPIAQDMERFSRSGLLFDEIKSLAIGIRKGLAGFLPACRPLAQSIEGKDINDVSKATRAVLDTLSQLEYCPIGFLPFKDIVKAAEVAEEKVSCLLEHIWDLRRQNERESRDRETSRTYHQEPFGIVLHYLQRIQLGLQNVVEVGNRADLLANSQLLLLKGDGGMGKTHLLCDFAKRRVQAQLPTILLMGQQLLSDDDPWVQSLQSLDLHGVSSDVFVGALEACAQASGCRALVIVDALNEGNGRKIWPVHLPSFLARFEKSPWISVVMSVRSSYEEYVIRDDIRRRASSVTHHGFDDHQYNAAKTFFAHYGLEFPSAPILQPEFRNPLFLKTLCKGLRDSGQRRIPKGFHGITAVFDLYLKVINTRLAMPESLDYDPRDNLVRKALEKIAERLSEGETRWLLRPEARSLVDLLLPGRDYSRSLYLALVTEGILTENMDPSSGETDEEIVFITYDRFADHIVADHLLRTYLDRIHPDTALLSEEALSFLGDEEKYVRPGLIEALCIQVPERAGQELARLTPGVIKHWGFAHAFLESVAWRKPDAFSEDTLEVLNELTQREAIRDELFDTVMSVSTVPGHRFNADYLHNRLLQDSMPDRDSWWSTYLHRAWETQGSVDRIVDWASDSSADVDIDDEVTDLAATALAWMFTTPNRFLRDRATKALVTLLTGRLESAGRLVDRFAGVDDPYVAERVYAVTYGIAMRSHDAEAVEMLALSVYERVFASGAPPAHILLRDYARGVIERAIYLGSDLSIDEHLIRPPYASNWPNIPSEDSIEALTPNRDGGAWDSGDLEWSKNRIWNSVMGDFLNDFARYVIGTESEPCWLSLRLGDDPWQSPDERTEALLTEFSEVERASFAEFRRIESKPPPILTLMQQVGLGEGDGELTLSGELELHRAKLEAARQLLMSSLTEDHRIELESILQAESDGPPRFDVSAIQRYVLWRVFDLGWTIERFGQFDRFSIGDHGRSASKSERIGKKYQWIAYHEILAFVSDHYQYRERYFNDEGDRRYEGPWQLGIRDIDPSCTLRSTQGGTSWGPHPPSWWGREKYDAWYEDRSHQQWLAQCQGLPKIEQLLEVVKPNGGTQWLNVDGSFLWRESHPADQEPWDRDRRELRIELTGYFVLSEKAEPFISWARSVDLWKLRMPNPPKSYSIYVGEYGWAEAFEQECLVHSDYDCWVRPGSPSGKQCPVAIRPVAFNYLAESGGFDCSVEENIDLRLPCHELVGHFDLRQLSSGVAYADSDGKAVALDPTAHAPGPAALLVSKGLLEEYLRAKHWSLCWVIMGEKRVVSEVTSDKYHGRLEISGAYHHTQDGPVGFLNYHAKIPEDGS